MFRRQSTRSISSASSHSSTGGGKTKLSSTKARCKSLFDVRQNSYRRSRSRRGALSLDNAHLDAPHLDASLPARPRPSSFAALPVHRYSASRLNEDWNEIEVLQPPSTLLIDAASARIERDMNGRTPRGALVRSQLTKTAINPGRAERKVSFTTANDTIESNKSPRDLRNSWDQKDIPRTLRNFEQIYRHRGLAVCYPDSLSARSSKSCMIRIEELAVARQIIEDREAHKRVVMAEQARQKNLGLTDSEALMKIASRHSERSVEIASSSWWLQRMNYKWD